MRLALRPPLVLLAIALLGLILLLATLQYVWLGRISEAERERLRATLASRAAEFSQDFDRELTRAYLLFQAEAPKADPDASALFAERYDRWQATSAYPRVLKDFHVATRGSSGDLMLRRFDTGTRTLQPAAWPPSMSDWRTRLDVRGERPPGDSSLVIRRLPAPIWETVPALVVPAPILFLSERPGPPVFAPPEFSYTLLTLDLDYVKNELLPSLAQRHFHKAGEKSDYHVAVVDRGGNGSVVYQSTPSFSPRQAESGDASAGLFQVRSQDFGAVAAEVKRFTMFSAATTRIEHHLEARDRRNARIAVRGPAQQMSIVVQQGPGAEAIPASAIDSPNRLKPPGPRWEVIVRHPAGSLEAFVGSTRRRNLLISTSILGILGASMALLIVSTRRSQELARQQLEFVAGVSHELRTPLAVIRSAAENLADGVVKDDGRVREYGELLRAEGRRLSEMVEQILEFAGIQSGRRGFSPRSVFLQPLVEDVLAASQALIESAGIRVDVDWPAGLPPVAGDEAALRRVFQNLIGNAIKYGGSGGWIGVRARQAGPHLDVAVCDKGIGIAATEQARIFEPFYRAADVVSARIQGAGLGLSLVRRIVDGHGGRVSVKSAPGAGSEFVVTLPVADPQLTEPVRATHSDAAAAPLP
jgi:signal transduction histidine kinase